MANETRAAYKKEMEFQLRMLQNLKRWAQNMLVLSSIAFSLILFGTAHHTIQVFGIVLMVLSLSILLLLGWTIKKGTDNLNLLLEKSML